MGVRHQFRNVSQAQGVQTPIGARNEQLAITSKAIAEVAADSQIRANRNALQVDVRQFWYFKRRFGGRPCSCVGGDENTPHSKCLVCYNTGWVGGFDKYGTQTEVVDATYPGMVMINTHPNFEANTRPVFMVLDDDAKSGAFTVTVPIRRGDNYIDVLQVFSNEGVLGADGSIHTQCRQFGTNTWMDFNSATVQSIIRTPSCSSLEIAVYMKRRNTKCMSPMVSHVYLRYGLLSKASSIIKADIPLNTESITMLEYGWEESFGTISMFVDPSIKSYTNDDFMFYLDKAKFWKITEATPNHVLQRYISFSLQARYMQPHEIATRMPV